MTAAITEEARAFQRFNPSLFRAIRESRGLSQQRLAEELGVSRLTVWRYEAGTRRPRGATLVRYVELMDELQKASA